MSRGGRREGAGRRREPTTARAALHVRVQREDLDRWQLAAEHAGESLSERVREVLDRWSEAVLDAPSGRPTLEDAAVAMAPIYECGRQVGSGEGDGLHHEECEECAAWMLEQLRAAYDAGAAGTSDP